MPHDHRTEIVVGVVVTIALLILIFGIMWGKQFEWFSERQRIVVRFEDIKGLERGDPVFVRGLQKGTVEYIGLEADGVIVRLSIDRDVLLFSDLRIVVESVELMGGKQITVYPGESGQPADLSRSHGGETGSDVQTLFTDARKTMARIDSVLTQIGTFLEQDRLERIVENVEESSALARKMLAENRESLRNTVKRLGDMTRSLQEDSTVVRLGGLFSKIDSTLTQIIHLSMLAESENGTIGKLLQDRWLYDQLLKTASDLNALVEDIRENPKKYIRVSVF